MKYVGSVADVSGFLVTGDPCCNLFRRPAVSVVEVDDQNRQSVTFLAARGRAGSDGLLHTIENAVEILGGASRSGISRHAIHAVIGSSKRTRGVRPFEVIAIRLLRTPYRAGSNIGCQLLLAMN